MGGLHRTVSEMFFYSEQIDPALGNGKACSDVLAWNLTESARREPWHQYVRAQFHLTIHTPQSHPSAPSPTDIGGDPPTGLTNPVSTHLVSGDAPDGLELQRQLAVFRRSHPKPHQLDVARVRRLEPGRIQTL